MHGIPSGGCSRCETLPEALEGPGRLFLWFPVRHSQAQAVHHLQGLGRTAQPLPGGDGVAVNLAGEEAPALARSLAERLGAEESNGTRVLWMKGTGDPGLPDFPRVTNLWRFVAAGARGVAARSALRPAGHELLPAHRPGVRHLVRLRP
jgi:hypothetical protein